MNKKGLGKMKQLLAAILSCLMVVTSVPSAGLMVYAQEVDEQLETEQAELIQEVNETAEEMVQVVEENEIVAETAEPEVTYIDSLPSYFHEIYWSERYPGLVTFDIDRSFSEVEELGGILTLKKDGVYVVDSEIFNIEDLGSIDFRRYINESGSYSVDLQIFEKGYSKHPLESIKNVAGEYGYVRPDDSVADINNIKWVYPEFVDDEGNPEMGTVPNGIEWEGSFDDADYILTLTLEDTTSSPYEILIDRYESNVSVLVNEDGNNAICYYFDQYSEGKSILRAGHTYVAKIIAISKDIENFANGEEAVSESIRIEETDDNTINVLLDHIENGGLGLINVYTIDASNMRDVYLDIYCDDQFINRVSGVEDWDYNDDIYYVVDYTNAITESGHYTANLVLNDGRQEEKVSNVISFDYSAPGASMDAPYDVEFDINGFKKPVGVLFNGNRNDTYLINVYINGKLCDSSEEEAMWLDTTDGKYYYGFHIDESVKPKDIYEIKINNLSSDIESIANSAIVSIKYTIPEDAITSSALNYLGWSDKVGILSIIGCDDRTYNMNYLLFRDDEVIFDHPGSTYTKTMDLRHLFTKPGKYALGFDGGWYPKESYRDIGMFDYNPSEKMDAPKNLEWIYGDGQIPIGITWDGSTEQDYVVNIWENECSVGDNSHQPIVWSKNSDFINTIDDGRPVIYFEEAAGKTFSVNTVVRTEIMTLSDNLIERANSEKAIKEIIIGEKPQLPVIPNVIYDSSTGMVSFTTDQDVDGIMYDFYLGTNAAFGKLINRYLDSKIDENAWDEYINGRYMGYANMRHCNLVAMEAGKTYSFPVNAFISDSGKYVLRLQVYKHVGDFSVRKDAEVVAEFNYQLPEKRIDTPINVHMVGDTLVWDGVDKAAGYIVELQINSGVIKQYIVEKTNSIDIAAIVKDDTNVSSYETRFVTATVFAVSADINYANSLRSAKATYTIPGESAKGNFSYTGYNKVQWSKSNPGIVEVELNRNYNNNASEYFDIAYDGKFVDSVYAYMGRIYYEAGFYEEDCENQVATGEFDFRRFINESGKYSLSMYISDAKYFNDIDELEYVRPKEAVAEPENIQIADDGRSVRWDGPSDADYYVEVCETGKPIERYASADDEGNEDQYKKFIKKGNKITLILPREVSLSNEIKIRIRALSKNLLKVANSDMVECILDANKRVFGPLDVSFDPVHKSLTFIAGDDGATGDCSQYLFRVIKDDIFLSHKGAGYVNNLVKGQQYTVPFAGYISGDGHYMIQCLLTTANGIYIGDWETVAEFDKVDLEPMPAPENIEWVIDSNKLPTAVKWEGDTSYSYQYSIYENDNWVYMSVWDNDELIDGKPGVSFSDVSYINFKESCTYRIEVFCISDNPLYKSNSTSTVSEYTVPGDDSWIPNGPKDITLDEQKYDLTFEFGDVSGAKKISYVFGLYRDGERVASRSYTAPKTKGAKEMVPLHYYMAQSGHYTVECTARLWDENGNPFYDKTENVKEYDYTVPSTRISTPGNARFEGNVFKWDKVKDARGYAVQTYFNGKTNNCFCFNNELSELDLTEWLNLIRYKKGDIFEAEVYAIPFDLHKQGLSLTSERLEYGKPVVILDKNAETILVNYGKAVVKATVLPEAEISVVADSEEVNVTYNKETGNYELSATKAGDYTVTFSADESSATFALSVRDYRMGLSGEELMNLCIGEKKKLSIINWQTGEEVQTTYKSSKATVAKVEADGTVTAVAKGNSEITMTTVDGIVIMAFVSVTKDAPTLSIDKTKAVIGWWQEAAVKVSVDPEKYASNVEVTTSNDDALKVTYDDTEKTYKIAVNYTDDNKRAGDYKVTFKLGTRSAVFSLSVKDYRLSLLGSELLNLNAMNAGDSIPVRIIDHAKGDVVVKATFVSSNPKVATATPEGDVTAVDDGNAEITATTFDGISILAPVTVKKKLSAFRLMNQEKKVLEYGDEDSVGIEVNPANVNPQAVLKAESNNPKLSAEIIGNKLKVRAVGSVTKKEDVEVTVSSTVDGSTLDPVIKEYTLVPNVVVPDTATIDDKKFYAVAVADKTLNDLLEHSNVKLSDGFEWVNPDTSLAPYAGMGEVNIPVVFTNEFTGEKTYRNAKVEVGRYDDLLMYTDNELSKLVVDTLVINLYLSPDFEDFISGISDVDAFVASRNDMAKWEYMVASSKPQIVTVDSADGYDYQISAKQKGAANVNIELCYDGEVAIRKVYKVTALEGIWAIPAIGVYKDDVDIDYFDEFVLDTDKSKKYVLTNDTYTDDGVGVGVTVTSSDPTVLKVVKSSLKAPTEDTVDSTELTALKAGVVTLKFTSADARKTSQEIKVTVVDNSEDSIIISKNVIDINTALENATDTVVISNGFGGTLSDAEEDIKVEGTAGVSAKVVDKNAGIVAISAGDDSKSGTLKLTVTVDSYPKSFDLKVNVKNVAPKVTVKQTQNYDTLLENVDGEFTIVSDDGAIDSVVVDNAPSASGARAVSYVVERNGENLPEDYEYTDTVLKIKNADQNKLTVTVTVAGYKAINVPVTMKMQTASFALSAKAGTVFPSLGASGAARVNILQKKPVAKQVEVVDEDLVSIDTVKGTGTYEAAVKDGSLLITLVDGIVDKKGDSVSISYKNKDMTEPIKLAYTIKSADLSKAKIVLGASTLTMYSNKGQEAVEQTSFGLTDGFYADELLKDVIITEKVDAKLGRVLNKALTVGYDSQKGKIVVTKASDDLKAGTYTFNLSLNVGLAKPLTSVLKVKVVDNTANSKTAAKLSVSVKNNIDVLDRTHTSMVLVPKVTNVPKDASIELVGIVGKDASLFTVDEDGKVLLGEDATVLSKETYLINAKYLVKYGTTQLELTSAELKIKFKQKNPKITLKGNAAFTNTSHSAELKMIAMSSTKIPVKISNVEMVNSNEDFGVEYNAESGCVYINYEPTGKTQRGKAYVLTLNVYTKDGVKDVKPVSVKVKATIAK